MKDPVDIASEFVRTINALNSVPGMMTSHDLGKEALAREVIYMRRAAREMQSLVDERINHPTLGLTERTEWVSMRNAMKNLGLWNLRREGEREKQ